MQKRWVVDETGERIFACENEAEAQAKVAELVAEKRTAWMAENGWYLRLEIADLKGERDALFESLREEQKAHMHALRGMTDLRAERDALQAQLNLMSRPAPDPAAAPVGDGIETAPQA